MFPQSSGTTPVILENQLSCTSPGLVVMGGDLCSKGRKFESHHRTLDGHFLTFICCKNCIVCLKK